jgi:C4-dicarboxylate-specific signal transduction histidine kinase
MLKKQVNKLECSLPEGLPAVTGSYQKLEQVIVNLIQNACESKDGKKVNLEIKTCFNQEKNSLEISIKDNGDGIAATKLKYILDPFFTTKRANGGTGLGLSVSMGILKEFKGEMHVDSTEGKGSTFTVSIPLK